MRVKKFVARTLAEALVQVKTELGSDAVILHTTTVTVGGFLGLFGKRKIEVMAAVEDRPSGERKAEEQDAGDEERSGPVVRLPHAGKSHHWARVKPGGAAGAPAGIAGGSAKQSPLAAAAQAHSQTQAAPRPMAAAAYAGGTMAMSEAVGGSPALNSVQEEMADMKAMMSQLMQMVGQPQAGRALEPDLRSLLAALVKGGVHDEVALTVVNRVRNRITKGQGSWSEAREIARQVMISDLGAVRTVDVGSRVVALVGPTGVGKTTTVAKLAAHLTLHKRKRIALITADTYRVAAVDQLRTYAEILNVPLEVVYDQRDVKGALTRHQDKELILVDTAGRSPKNAVHMAELKSYLDELQVGEKYLVMSLTSGYRDATTIVDNYLPLSFDQFLFTKWDEAAAPGLLYNMIRKYKRPLSYITTGQNVPDDIAVADPEFIIQAILGD